jgi:hypothetical protein
VAVSALLGFVTGVWLYPTWQDVIEPAQVLAGVVQYPPDNPVYLYSTSTWTMLHQVVALCIRAGIAERSLAIVISGMLGAVSFVGVALTARAMGATALVAALCPVFIHASGATRFLPGYPVDLVGWPYTYGVLSHGLLLCLVALIGLRRDRAAAFLLGVLPAIHPGVGLWAWCLVGTLGVVYRGTAPARARTVRYWLAGGLLLTVISGLIHVWWFAPDLSTLTPGSPELLRGIRHYWDTHRIPMDWTSPSVLTAVALPLLFAWWQHKRGHLLPPGSQWIASALVIAVCIAVVADVIVRVAPEGIGTFVARPMARRLLCLPLLAAMAWFIGVCNSAAVPVTVRVVTSWLFVALTITFIKPVGHVPMPYHLIREWVDPFVFSWSRVASLVMAISAAAVLVALRLPVPVQRWCAGWPSRSAAIAWPAALVVMSVFRLGEAVMDGHAALAEVQDHRSNVVLSAVHAREGLLLTGGNLHLIQAATRRPILLDGGALDSLVYVPGGAVVSEHIMQRVYGLTLMEPASDDWGPDGALPPWAPQDTWATRSLEDWRAIRDEFGVTDVLTPPEWTLQLPIVAKDDRLVLWSIPAR